MRAEISSNARHRSAGARLPRVASASTTAATSLRSSYHLAREGSPLQKYMLRSRTSAAVDAALAQTSPSPVVHSGPSRQERSAVRTTSPSTAFRASEGATQARRKRGPCPRTSRSTSASLHSGDDDDCPPLWAGDVATAAARAGTTRSAMARQSPVEGSIARPPPCFVLLRPPVRPSSLPPPRLPASPNQAPAAPLSSTPRPSRSRTWSPARSDEAEARGTAGAFRR